MKIDVSFWNYTRQNACRTSPREIVKEWKELGITTGFSFRYDPEEDSRDEMIALIGECEKNGLDLIVYDLRVYSPPDNFDEREYAARVRAAHPCIVTSTSAPGSARPQTGTGVPRCRTIPS